MSERKRVWDEDGKHWHWEPEVPDAISAKDILQWSALVDAAQQVARDAATCAEQVEAAVAERDARLCEGCVSCDTCVVQNAAWVKFGALEADTGFACNCWSARAEEGSEP